MSFRFRILSVFLLVQLLVVMGLATSLKCTDKDPRKNLFPECMQGGDRVLWCDYSTKKSIPNPDKIYKDKTCRNSVALHIEDNCLEEISKYEIKKYPNLTKLNCASNFIRTIESFTFSGNGKLLALDLSSNLIAGIQRRAFYGLRKLESLNLTNNRISRISSTMFTDLVSLKELSLQGNSLQVLLSGSFHFVKTLKVLDLSGNKISHIQPKAFANLESLERLHLDGNELAKLESGLFSYTPNLRVLTLSYNSFTAVPVFSMNSLPNLHTLNLGHNMLEELTIAPMSNLSKLQNLSLQNNSIMSIPEDAFHRMPLLRHLNLSSNRMEDIAECAFCHSCNLEVLSLSNNALKTPHAEWFTALIDNGALNGIEIHGNQWMCDCDAIPFYDFLTELPSPEPLNINCSWPKQHRGKDLFAVIHRLRDDLKCRGKSYRPVQRQCNFTTPIQKKQTDVYTYKPKLTSTTEPVSETIPYKKDTGKASAFEQEPDVHEEKGDSTPKDYTLIFIGILVCLLVVLAGYVGYRRVRKYAKPTKRRGDVESQRDNRVEGTEGRNGSHRTSSNATVSTRLSVESDSSIENDTQPSQPQGDLRSSLSDSERSSTSRCSPSEVDVSTCSDEGLTLRTAYTDSSAPPSRQTSTDSGCDDTIPKEVASQHDEDLSLLKRCDPIGGNDSNGMH